MTVTANSYTIVYGDELPEFEFTSEGATLEGTPEITCEATATTSVGTYPIVISKGGVKNYNDTYVNGILTITKAPLTILAGTYSREQGMENPEFTLTYEGFKNGETEAVLTKQPSVSCEATETSVPGEYAVTISGAEAQNYEISYVSGKLTVTVPSGVEDVATNGRPFDVYTVTGRKVRHQVTSLKGLTKGVYVVEGHKVIVR